MNLSDFAYKLVTGEWRIDRARAQERAKSFPSPAPRKRMALYAGANPRAEPPDAGDPLDAGGLQAGVRADHPAIRAARQMEEDTPFFDGILR